MSGACLGDAHLSDGVSSDKGEGGNTSFSFCNFSSLPDSIVGVGVLLRCIPDGGTNSGLRVLAERTRIVLGSSDREVGKPWICLEASVVFIARDASKLDERHRAVCVKFKKLWPWSTRVFGKEWGENRMNRVDWYFSEKNRKFEEDQAIRSVKSNNYKKRSTMKFGILMSLGKEQCVSMVGAIVI